MMAAAKKVAIPGSQKIPLPGAKAIAPAPSDERLEVTIRLRPKTPLPDAREMLALSETPIPILTHDQYEKKYGSLEADIALIRKFARAHNLIVVRESPARRSVMLSGTVADFNKAFEVNLKTYEYPAGTYRGRTGSIHIPAGLSKIVEGVFGLDNRPVATRHGVLRRESAAPADGATAFTSNQLARIYNFPARLDGRGETIGLIELGGGYRPQDITTYFNSLGIPAPTVIPVSVDGAANSPTKANSDDGEVVLDIQVAGAAAPGAKIVVYFAPNDKTSKGFLDALTKAVHDIQYNPSIISISWGGPESPRGNSFQMQFDQALQTAAMLGITVLVAAGDDGAADMEPKEWDGKAHVDFPSASPFILSCGGTRLIASGSRITKESVWNQNSADVRDDSFGSGGGGVSRAFPLPAYQSKASVPLSVHPRGHNGRGVPDVTGDGDPDSGYKVLVDGKSLVFGGTSAVAPLWAALIARINQKVRGRVGFINPRLYALAANSGAFHDVTLGNNRITYKKFSKVGYDAVPGWDACSGLGSPDGTILSSVLTASKPVTGTSRKKAKNKAVPK
jgi:kumamolisin